MKENDILIKTVNIKNVLRNKYRKEKYLKLKCTELK